MQVTEIYGWEATRDCFAEKPAAVLSIVKKNMDIKSVVEDRKGQIWIGTWEQGLLRYSPQEELYYTYDGINPW